MSCQMFLKGNLSIKSWYKMGYLSTVKIFSRTLISQVKLSPNCHHRVFSASPCCSSHLEKSIHAKTSGKFTPLIDNHGNSTQLSIQSLRGFYSKSGGSVDKMDSLTQDDMSLKELRERARQEENAGWLIRLANENGYLSWCRNTYIGTVVAATIYMQGPLVPYAKEAAFLFLIISGVNMACGTFSYVYTLSRLRRKMLVNFPLWMFKVIMASVHLMVWLGAAAVYMGFVEEDPEDLSVKKSDV